jgi:hypothetical protein
MQRLGRAVVVMSFVALTGLAVGCGTSASPEMQKGLSELPRVVSGLQLPSVPVPIEIGDDGKILNVAGLDTSVVDAIAENVLGYKVIGSLAVLSKAQVDWLKRSNIQHITLALRPQGAFVLVNGKPLPYLDWQTAGTEDVMANLVDALGRVQQKKGSGEAYLLTPDAFDLVKSLLPMARNVGLRVDIKLPRDKRFAEIPLAGEDAFNSDLTDAEINQAPLSSADIELAYKSLPDGTWVPSLAGVVSTADLQKLAEPFGVKVPTLRLRKDIEKRLQAEGFKSVGVESRADGVFFTVDGKLLPHLAWSNATLSNLAQVLQQLYPPGTELPSDATYVPVLRSIAPMLNDFSVAGLVKFPQAAAK